MKVSAVLNRVIRSISLKTGVSEKEIETILDSHFSHIKKALSQDKVVEVKLDYFGKFLPIINTHKNSKLHNVKSS